MIELVKIEEPTDEFIDLFYAILFSKDALDGLCEQRRRPSDFFRLCTEWMGDECSVWFIVEDQRPVGVIYSDWHGAKMLNLHISTVGEFRGKRVVEACRQFAALPRWVGRGIGGILHIKKGNFAAQALARRIGFTDTGCDVLENDITYRVFRKEDISDDRPYLTGDTGVSS